MSARWADWRKNLPSGSTRLFGILGAPLEHSLSPAIHTAVLRSLGIDGIYLPVPIAALQIRSFFDLAPSLGFVGVNVTTPFKEAAFGHVRPHDRETVRTGMVNTVVFGKRSGRSRPGGAGSAPADVRGFGTDGAGTLRWLQSYGAAGVTVGILGFGPTARSLVHRLWWKEPKRSVKVVTRRPAIVSGALASWPQSGRGTGRLVGGGPTVSGWDDLPEGVDIWVSTLPPGTPLPEVFWARAKGSRLLDMNYGNARSDLLAEARQRGIPSADGLGPLLEQAALSLSFWLHEDIDPDRFRRALGVPARRLGPAS